MTWPSGSTRRFGETFTVPEPYILKETAKIYDLQVVDKQMSKSIGGAGCLWLLDEPAVSAKKIKSAVTDTGREVRFDPVDKPGVSNLLGHPLGSVRTSVAELETDFDGRGYGDLKKELAEVYVDFVTPFRDRTLALLDDPAELDRDPGRGCRAGPRRGAARRWPRPTTGSGSCRPASGDRPGARSSGSRSRSGAVRLRAPGLAGAAGRPARPGDPHAT